MRGREGIGFGSVGVGRVGHGHGAVGMVSCCGQEQEKVERARDAHQAIVCTMPLRSLTCGDSGARGLRAGRKIKGCKVK